jgi:hypothetical protein
MIKKIGILLILLVLNSCSIFDEPETEIEKLPPITQTGRWSFGCLVNGKAVRITNSSLMRAETQQDVFIIRFTNTIDNKLWAENLKQFEFRMTDPLEIGIEYDLTNAGIYKLQYIEYLNDMPNCIYEPENITSGSLTFSNIDRTNHIVSGTFEFETVTQDCDTIRVTDGRFDLHYYPY